MNQNLDFFLAFEILNICHFSNCFPGSVTGGSVVPGSTVGSSVVGGSVVAGGSVVCPFESQSTFAAQSHDWIDCWNRVPSKQVVTTCEYSGKNGVSRIR